MSANAGYRRLTVGDFISWFLELLDSFMHISLYLELLLNNTVATLLGLLLLVTTCCLVEFMLLFWGCLLRKSCSSRHVV